MNNPITPDYAIQAMAEGRREPSFAPAMMLCRFQKSQARKGWSTAEHLLESNHPISRLSLLSSKFVVESLVARVGHWPYPPGELQLMTIALLWWQPDMIFEWGTNLGNSARIFHWIAEAFDINTQIHSIDLPPDVSHAENVRELRGLLVGDFSDVHLHLGDGVNKAIELCVALKPRKPLFYVDGDHSAETVTRELEAIRTAVPIAPILLDDTHDWHSPQLAAPGDVAIS